jgi:hypothetical protein
MAPPRTMSSGVGSSCLGRDRQQTGATATGSPAAADAPSPEGFRGRVLADDRQQRRVLDRQPPSGEHNRQRLPAPQRKVRLSMYLRPRSQGQARHFR